MPSFSVLSVSPFQSFILLHQELNFFIFKLFCMLVPFAFHHMHLLLGLCKKGHYCNQNSSKELPCRAGTYSNIVGSFNASNCRICPINSYCPSGSSSPKQCPRHGFRPARLMKVKLYLGKGKQSDCRSCPVDPCDKDGRYTKILYICSMTNSICHCFFHIAASLHHVFTLTISSTKVPRHFLFIRAFTVSSLLLFSHIKLTFSCERV